MTTSENTTVDERGYIAPGALVDAGRLAVAEVFTPAATGHCGNHHAPTA